MVPQIIERVELAPICKSAIVQKQRERPALGTQYRIELPLRFALETIAQPEFPALQNAERERELDCEIGSFVK